LGAAPNGFEDQWEARLMESDEDAMEKSSYNLFIYFFSNKCLRCDYYAHKSWKETKLKLKETMTTIFITP
jgi:hypothetical protein